MDPEQRDELLRGIDEELDDSPKGRVMRDTVNDLFARSHRDEAAGEQEEEEEQ
jgi:hypothetical protein